MKKKEERKMQKICFGLFGVVVITNATAADLCVRNDTMVVAMNPTVNATSSTYTSWTEGSKWSATFNYGVLHGIGICGGAWGTASAAGVEPPINIQNGLSLDKDGTQCYCKILRPIQSRWVYSGWERGSSAQPLCKDYCAQGCASAVRGSHAVRKGLFKSVNEID